MKKCPAHFLVPQALIHTCIIVHVGDICDASLLLYMYIPKVSFKFHVLLHVYTGLLQGAGHRLQ